jgi:hypothetical protein
MRPDETEHAKEMIRVIRMAFEAIDSIPHDQRNGWRESNHKLRLAWLACRDILQDIRTVEMEHMVRCEHCIGTGKVRLGSPAEQSMCECPRCHGKGYT